MSGATIHSDNPEVGAKLRALDRLLVSKELVALEQALGGFNLFRILGITEKELFHSRLLAWLLKPHESHGLGDLFLRRWLMRILVESSSTNPRAPSVTEVDGAQWVDAEVATEVVLDSRRRIDVQAALTLRAQPQERRWWVVVEAKVDSLQSDDQLADYREAVERKASPEDKMLFVFLTRDLEKPDDPAWHQASFHSVHEALEECLGMREGSVAAGPGMLLGHYVRILEEQFMSDSNVANRVRAIFKEHPEAMAAIEANWPDPVWELNRFLQAHITEKAAALGIHVFPTRAKNYFRFAAISWKVDLAGPEVYGIVEVDEKSISIRIFATPACPAGKKQALVDASKSEPFELGRKTNAQYADTPTLDSGWAIELLGDPDATKVHEHAANNVEGALETGRLRQVIDKIQSLLE